MKHVISIVSLCLITLSGFSQPPKYSFEEVSYSPGEKTKDVKIQSSDIETAQGMPKYSVKIPVDIQNKKINGTYVYLSEYGKSGELCMSMITHVGHLYLGMPNTGGVEAYACRNTQTKVVIYFLVGASTSDTLKFLIYEPSSNNLKTLN
ncbi:hypothetical protein [Spirosoma arcticum]